MDDGATVHQLPEGQDGRKSGHSSRGEIDGRPTGSDQPDKGTVQRRPEVEGRNGDSMERAMGEKFKGDRYRQALIDAVENIGALTHDKTMGIGTDIVCCFTLIK